jgi:flagella basal body P-ring formation protein FlgA
MRTIRHLALVLLLVSALPGAEPAAEAATCSGVSMAPPLSTTQTGVPLSRDELVALLVGDLTSHFNLEGELQLELVRPYATPEQLAAVWSLRVVEYPSLLANAMLVRCRVLADGVVLDEVTLILRASLWRDVWVARQPLRIGTLFDPALLETRRVDVLRERDVIPAVAADSTFAFVRGVQPGHLLTWRDIMRRPLVKKGDVVEVSASDGLLVVQMKALAMQNGGKGEAVTVRNMDSRKDFTAFVIDENRVQVRF